MGASSHIKCVIRWLSIMLCVVCHVALHWAWMLGGLLQQTCSGGTRGACWPLVPPEAVMLIISHILLLHPQWHGLSSMQPVKQWHAGHFCSIWLQLLLLLQLWVHNIWWRPIPGRGWYTCGACTWLEVCGIAQCLGCCCHKDPIVVAHEDWWQRQFVWQWLLVPCNWLCSIENVTGDDYSLHLLKH